MLKKPNQHFINIQYLLLKFIDYYFTFIRLIFINEIFLFILKS